MLHVMSIQHLQVHALSLIHLLVQPNEVEYFHVLRNARYQLNTSHLIVQFCLIDEDKFGQLGF